jgi:hypothetical protein
MRYLVLMVAAAAIVAGAANAASTPTMQLVRTSPLVVHGSAFAPRQVVKVTTPSGNVVVRTSIYGQFTVTLPSVVDRCSSTGSIFAVTQYGRTIATLHIPRPMCLPARSAGSPEGSSGLPQQGSVPSAARTSGSAA